MSTLEAWLIAHHAAHLARRTTNPMSTATNPEPISSSPLEPAPDAPDEPFGISGQFADPPRPDERCPDEDEANAATANVTIPEPGSAVPLVEVPLA